MRYHRDVVQHKLSAHHYSVCIYILFVCMYMYLCVQQLYSYIMYMYMYVCIVK